MHIIQLLFLIKILLRYSYRIQIKVLLTELYNNLSWKGTLEIIWSNLLSKAEPQIWLSKALPSLGLNISTTYIVKTLSKQSLWKNRKKCYWTISLPCLHFLCSHHLPCRAYLLRVSKISCLMSISASSYGKTSYDSIL